jgi:hypothetical protein
MFGTSVPGHSKESVMRGMTASLVFLVGVLLGGLAAAAPVSPSVRNCVMEATRIAIANRNSKTALASLYDTYLGDAFARQAARPGNWDKFSSKEKALQRAWAKKRTIAAVPQFFTYASARIEAQRQQGRIVYGRAILAQGSTSLTWYLTGKGCRFYELKAGGFSLSQLVGNYQRRGR